MDPLFDFGDLTKDTPLTHSEKGFVWGFTTKKEGDARKPEILEGIVTNIPLAIETVVVPAQNHGTDIKVIEEVHNKIEKVSDVDGLITKLPKVLLTVLSADCVPIVFIDTKNNIVGVSHQGWKGTLARMAQKMITSMVEQGADINSISCYIGPSIKNCCYNVEKERYSQFKREFFAYAHLCTQAREGKYYIDLQELNSQQLLESGIPFVNVSTIQKCTCTNDKEFFSYRRDKKDEFGEMLAYVALEK